MACEGATGTTCTQYTNDEPLRAAELPVTGALAALAGLTLIGYSSVMVPAYGLSIAWDTSTSYPDQVVQAYLRLVGGMFDDPDWFDADTARDAGGLILDPLVIGQQYLLLVRVKDADEANAWIPTWFTFTDDLIVSPYQVYFGEEPLTHDGELIYAE
jgi:hypothetical protein